MTLRNDPFAEWDAAYVLGALSPSQRREFEQHLAGCAECTAAVGELAGMSGLLARVPAEDAWQSIEPKPIENQSTEARPLQASAAPADSLPRLLAAARRSRMRRRTWTVVATLAVAACAAAAALIVPGIIAGAVDGASSAVVAMSQVNSSSLSADIRLVSEPWGTRIESNCHYGEQTSRPQPPPSKPPGGSGYPTVGIAYAMYVTDRSGAETQVSSWLARPGGTVTPTATTSLSRTEIESVDIRAVSTGEVMLRSSFDR